MSGASPGPGSASPQFKAAARAAVGDSRIAEIFDRSTRRKDEGRRATLPELGGPLAIEVRELAARIKDHTIQNLDRYLDQLIEQIEAHGGQVHFARTAEHAHEIIQNIAAEEKVKTIVKSKSMASEEIELNHALEAADLEVTETDLGEYILQLADEKPSHIVTPVAHKTKEDVAELFHEKLGIEYTDDPASLTAAARTVLREKFKNADMGIIGANFAVAETGTICIVTNEGNGRFCSSRPRVLVSLMGIEKIVPTMKHLPVFLKLLGKSATGQRLTCYTNLVTGPKREGDFDGPASFHLVLLDHGRTRILASEKYRTLLRCIRCGACLNACPVYRRIGGHAYESVYPGPIGSVLTPMLKSLEEYPELPLASSLCHACLEACPSRIDIPTMLLEMRNDLLRRGYAPFTWRIGFKFWRMGMKSKWLYRIGSTMARWFMRIGSKNGWKRSLPMDGKGWTAHRDFPVPASRPFHKRWERLKNELDNEG
jgi:L-lactate dehydrogenase complex protein LldF